MFCKSCDTTTTEKWDRGEEREVAFVQYVEITAPLDAVGKNLYYICVRLTK